MDIDETLREADAFGYVSARDRRLAGFYREEHDIPGPPVLVVGDPDKFARDVERMHARRRKQFDRMAENRWILRDPGEWWGQQL